jgi:hypothetical protein
MKCAECGYWWHEVGELSPRCHYDDPWPAPCEYDEPTEEEDDPSCSTCYNADQDTTDKVACCNCCEDYCFYTRA